MKLLLCPNCMDVRKLGYEVVTCECGKSSGYYEKDGLNAVYAGESIPLGFDNFSLRDAVDAEKYRTGLGVPAELGIRFEAFTIPECAPTIRREE